MEEPDQARCEAPDEARSKKSWLMNERTLTHMSMAATKTVVVIDALHFT